jgi:hypothetical protein
MEADLTVRGIYQLAFNQAVISQLRKVAVVAESFPPGVEWLSV